MKLRHALNGAIYTLQDDGNVQVEHEGKTGLFDPEGHYLRGEVTFADKHLIGWIGGPQLSTRGGFRGAQLPGDAPQASGPRPPPDLSRRLDPDGNDRRNPEMDLGLNGRKAIVTAASRGIGLSLGYTCHCGVQPGRSAQTP